MLSTCKKFSFLLAVCGAVPLVAGDFTPQADNPSLFKDEQRDAAAKPPREQYEALAREYQAQMAEFRKAATAAKTPEERAKASQLAPRVPDFARKMLELVDKHAEDPVVVEALVWVVQQGRQGPEVKQALEQLTKSHVRSDKLRSACLGLMYSQTPALSEKFLRAVLAENPHANMKGYATFGLAKVLQRKAQSAAGVQRAADSGKLSPRTAEFYGAEYLDELKKLDVAQAEAEVVTLLESAATEFKDVEVTRGGTVQSTLGKIVERDLFEIRFLSIGKVAPEIQGEGVDGVAFKLSDYRGKVVVLDFWGDW